MRKRKAPEAGRGVTSASITVRIPLDTLDRVRDHANTRGLTIGQIARLAFEAYLDRKGVAS